MTRGDPAKAEHLEVVMIQHRLIAALMFGVAAYSVIPLIFWMSGSLPKLQPTSENLLRMIASPLGIIFLSAAVWGYLFGHTICQHAQISRGWVKSLGIGVAIPALASATLSVLATLAGVLNGDISAYLLLGPLGGTLLISVVTFGGIYLLGGLTALLLDFGCKACARTHPGTRSPGTFNDNLT
ncbi:MAG: hypothetical protein ABW076_11190 [Candidatus Thiodiazotropha sp.]